MPYTNISWVKLKLELLSEHRFIEECDDFDKLIFLGLLMLAGLTQNKIPNSPKYIKRMLNLQLEEQIISEKIVKITSIFRGVVRSSEFIKFKNFNKLHNWFRSSEGVPKDTPRIEKIRIDQIRKEYIRIRGLSFENFSSDDFARTAKAIKTLLLKASLKDEVVVKSIEWAAAQKWCDWTLETIIRRFPDFLKYHNQPDLLKKFGKEMK